MAKILQEPFSPDKIAITTHSCGAIVEFSEKDICPDGRDGHYVVCPFCNMTPFINAKTLSWVRQIRRS